MSKSPLYFGTEWYVLRTPGTHTAAPGTRSSIQQWQVRCAQIHSESCCYTVQRYIRYTYTLHCRTRHSYSSSYAYVYCTVVHQVYIYTSLPYQTLIQQQLCICTPRPCDVRSSFSTSLDARSVSSPSLLFCVFRSRRRSCAASVARAFLGRRHRPPAVARPPPPTSLGRPLAAVVARPPSPARPLARSIVRSFARRRSSAVARPPSLSRRGSCLALK